MSIRPMLIGLAMFFLIFVLVSCGSAQPTSHPTAIPTIFFADTFTPQPTPTITLTVTASTTPTPSITYTPLPSATMDLTRAAFDAYHAPTEAAEATSVPLTEEARATTNAAFPEACGYQYPSVSPDGNWLADDCGEFHVVSRNGQKKIVITHKELAPPDTYVSDVIPYYWSKDSQNLYFTPRFCCADTDANGWGGPLYRLDLRSSKWAKMIGGGFFNYYSFSPTGRRLLYIPHDQGSGPPVELHIIDLKSGADQKLNLNSFEQAGWVLWKPDGTSFVISGQVGNFYEENRQFALLLVSLDDLSITELVSLGKHNELYATDWSNDDVLTISDCNYDGGYEICKSYPYDLKLLPTPKP